ncbi:hypothetical protein NL521_27995, partial [Klebsiella pneumoniae]|nr:hypothetical protein [Klebsiella pneumoniae]
IPQRAIQELLGKTFVTVAGANNEAVTKQVKLGPKVDNLQIVEEGLTNQDIVVVEGFAKTQPGTPLTITMIGLNDLIIPGAK